jgi:trans-aconitate methyltransferase
MTLPFDSTSPTEARIYNALLGGKDHFAADRAAAGRIVEIEPRAESAARQNRAFLGRAVRFLAREAGIRQFLDIGSGLPTVDNVHDVAQAIRPESRIVYVDNDPQVLAHARALLVSAPEGRTAYVDADLRDTGAVIAGASGTLDFAEPVAVLLIAILHFIPDADGPWEIVRRLMAAMPPGSYLAVSHAAVEHLHEGAAQELSKVYAPTGNRGVTQRPLPEVRRFFDGLELAEPGVTGIAAWRPGIPAGQPAESDPGRPLFYGGVATKTFP